MPVSVNKGGLNFLTAVVEYPTSRHETRVASTQFFNWELLRRGSGTRLRTHAGSKGDSVPQSNVSFSNMFFPVSDDNFSKMVGLRMAVIRNLYKGVGMIFAE